MKCIGINAELIKFLSGDFSLVSSKITRLDIYQTDGELTIEIEIDLLYSKKDNRLKLKFTGIEEYSFYYNSRYIFYNVEDYKFFFRNGFVYISFDPADDKENESQDDQDFIKSKKVEGYI